MKEGTESEIKNKTEDPLRLKKRSRKMIQA